MPCDSIQISEAVPFDKVDLPRMKRALEGEGWSVYLSNGTLSASRSTYEGNESFVLRKGDRNATIATNRPLEDTTTVASEIRRAYASRTVQDLASKYGWKVTKTEVQQLTFRR